MEPVIDHEIFTVVLRVCLKSLESTIQRHTLPILSISSSATAGRFRLIDCNDFLYHHTLTIYEFCNFPVSETAYAAISYIWRGNAVDEGTVGTRFSVAGAEDGDPVSVEVLRHACTAALRHNVKYIWLDRLCIMQTNRTDKNWQIQHMFRIYEGCTVSLVFPGGIQRLVCLDEPTAWIHRAWTLQEVLVPPCAEVVYKWPHGSGMFLGPYRGDIKELISGESAITPLRVLLALNSFSEVTFIPTRHGPVVPFRTSIFGLSTESLSPEWPERRTEIVIFMLRSALPDGTESLDIRAPAIWRSILFRTSSRPVDMVFSIMGIFGVTLDPHAFEADDRLGATVALMREILNQPGGRASWLGVAPHLPPHPRLSTVPKFPRTSVDGKVEFELDLGPEVAERGHNRSLGQTLSKRRLAILDPRSLPMPSGSVDEAGYLCITRKTIRVYPLQRERVDEDHHEHLELGRVSPPECCLYNWAINGTGWLFYDATGSHSNIPQDTILETETLAVLVSFHNEFSMSGLWEGPRFISAMLVREHAPNHYHIESYFELSARLETWVQTWEERELRIGGPNLINSTVKEDPHVI
jgi:hypothetical protein